jgi:large subunit ribosomal protein L5
MKKKYQEEVAPALMKKFNYKSVMQIPKLEKIVVNVGCGDARDNAKVLDAVVRDITTITGQKAVVTKARKSVANFKVREGMPVGVKVTLRQDRMWEFLDRLLNIALPRVRDFHGISANSFDGRGNFALGVREQLIFPRSITTRSRRSGVWTSPFAPLPRRTKRPKSSSSFWARRSFRHKEEEENG